MDALSLQIFYDTLTIQLSTYSIISSISILKDDLQIVLKVNCNLCLMSVKLYAQLRLNNFNPFDPIAFFQFLHLNNNSLKYL